MKFPLALALTLFAAPAHAADPFAKSASKAEHSLVDVVPSVPGVGLPRAQPKAVEEELATTPPSELNLRCQGFLAALGQASKLRRDVTTALDTDKAIDRLEQALVDEVVAAAGEGYSVKERLALAAETAKGMVPRMREQLTRFVTLLRKPSEADRQTLANQDAVCRAVLSRVKGE